MAFWGWICDVITTFRGGIPSRLRFQIPSSHPIPSAGGSMDHPWPPMAHQLDQAPGDVRRPVIFKAVGCCAGRSGCRFMVRVFVEPILRDMIFLCLRCIQQFAHFFRLRIPKNYQLRCKERDRSSEKNSCCNKKWCLHQALKWKWTYNLNVLWLSISLQKKHVILLLFHNDVFHPCFNGDLSSKGRKKSGVKPLLPCHPGTWSGIDLGPKFEQAIGKLLPLSSMQVNGR